MRTCSIRIYMCVPGSSCHGKFPPSHFMSGWKWEEEVDKGEVLTLSVHRVTHTVGTARKLGFTSFHIHTYMCTFPIL